MHLKTQIFSIVLNGSGITKTIIYTDDYFLSEDSSQLGSKVSYCSSTSQKVVVLTEDGISFADKKLYHLNSWQEKGQPAIYWKQKIEKMGEGYIRRYKDSVQLQERALLKKVGLNQDLAKLMPFVVPYEGDFYLTVEQVTLDRGKEIFKMQLTDDRLAKDEEKNIFHKYKKMLKQH